MEKTKGTITFSKKHIEMGKAVDAALKNVSKKLIEETKRENSYLIVADKNGNPKKVFAKDL